MPRRVLCLWLPEWPLQRVLFDHPEWVGLPVAVCQASRRTASRGTAGQSVAGGAGVGINPSAAVLACSVAAARRGVRVGLPAAEALALAAVGAERGQDAGPTRRLGGRLHLVPHCPDDDRAALARLARWCYRYSPMVCLEDAPAPESLVLDISGCGRLFGGEDALVRQLADELTARGGVVRCAVADTWGAAWALAHYGALHSLERAALGTSAVAPSVWCDGGPLTSGWLIAAEGTGLALAEQLPIEALRLPAAAADVLAALGLCTVGSLAKLPRAAVAARLGSVVLRRLDQLEGGLTEVVAPEPEVHRVSAEWVLEHPLADFAMLTAVLARLVDEVAAALAARQQAAQELVCWLRTEPATTFRLRLFRPTASPRHLLDLLCTRLEREPLPGEATAMRVWVTLTAPQTMRQQELFSDRRAAQQPLAELVDRLGTRLGREAVLAPRLVADAQPEFACRWVPLVGSRGAVTAQWAPTRRAARRPKATPGPAPAAEQAGLRPTQLLRRPEGVRVWSVAPTGPPQRLCWQGQEFALAQVWGPERIETGWWRGRSVGRDYFQVELADGRRAWLFRRQSDGQWFLHGWFS